MILPGGLLETLRIDHRSHRVSLNILKDDQATIAVIKKAFTKLATEFIFHIRREESVIYEYMLGEASLKSIALEGQEKLLIIEDLFLELKKVSLVEKKVWRAKAKLIAELVEHHTKQEEEVTFPVLEKQLTNEVDKRLLSKYKKFIKL